MLGEAHDPFVSHTYACLTSYYSFFFSLLRLSL